MKLNEILVKLVDELDNQSINTLEKLPTTVKSRQNKRFIESLRNSTYNYTEMFGELVDNSIDANASKIHINLFHDNRGGLNFLIIDNGCGMSGELLETAVEFGSNYYKDNTKTGKFGVGGSNATIALGKKREILTKKKNGELFYEYFSLDSLKDGDVWYPQVYKGNQTHQKFYNAFGLDESGTIIRISEVDKEFQLKKSESFDKFENDLIRYCGVTYNKKLNDFELYVNGKQVRPIDPILWDHKDIIQLGQGIIEIPDGSVSHDIKYRAVIFPDGGVLRNDIEENCDKEIHAMNFDNMGVFLNRNGRHIEGGLKKFGTHKLFSFAMMGTKQRWWSRFRIELEFNGDCDKKLGIAFSKNKTANADIDAVKEITKIIQSLQLLAARILDNDRSVNRNSEEKSKGDTSKQSINSKLKGNLKPIDVPKVKIEKKDSGQRTVKILNRAKKGKKAWIDYVEFQYEKGSPNDPIFEASQLNSNKTIVTWNVGHSFYKNCVAKLDDEKAVEWHALIFAWARAQMELIGTNIENASTMNQMMLCLSQILNKYYS